MPSGLQPGHERRKRYWASRAHACCGHGGQWVVAQDGSRLCFSGVAMEIPGVAKCTRSVFQQLKDDAIALVDVIAPPDFILDSPIARADGEVSAAVPQGQVGACAGPLRGPMVVTTKPKMVTGAWSTLAPSGKVSPSAGSGGKAPGQQQPL